jgi:hypothetical protein
MASDYRFGILWPLYCLSSWNLWLPKTVKVLLFGSPIFFYFFHFISTALAKQMNFAFGDES